VRSLCPEDIEFANHTYMLREYTLDRVKTDVLRHMKLRKPQRDCLEAFDNIFRHLPANLGSISQDELLKEFQDRRPSWDLERGFPRMTCHLATGVGKTRLMGALMAYLHKAEESSNFLLIAPRTTIVDKLVRESQAGHAKYIFVDPAFVEQPVVYHSGNFDSFDPREAEMGSGPTMWILSPQSMTGASNNRDLRFHRTSEYLGTSPEEYLRSLDDLVVFFDESHHLGHSSGDGKVPAWTQAVRDLSPRLLFAMTASPNEDAKVDALARYDLRDCLRDGLYTKGVRVIAKPRPDEMEDWDWDKVTLRYALQRLNAKQKVVRQFEEESSSDETVKPVGLVCAKDKAHAEKVETWLQSQLGEEAVLLVHSGMKESEYLQLLLSVEDPENPVRVIVNVFQLTEGWDVDNVYVIAPLRAMATFQGVIQTMGRGLRLPYGERVGRDEVDTLDVLCFGKQTMDEITDQILNEGYGSKEDQEAYLSVTEDDDVDNPPERISFEISRARDVEIVLPRVDWQRPNIDLSNLQLSVKGYGEPLAVDLDDIQTKRRLDGKPGFERSSFLSTVSALVMRKRQIIGSVTDAVHVRDAVKRYLEDRGHDEGDLVSYDPEYVARLCVKAIDNLLARTEPEYVKVPGETKITSESFEITIPDVENVPVSRMTSWSRNLKGVPINGWTRCAHEAVPFDTDPEFHVAKLIDDADEVDWWMRNLRKIFRLHTPAGGYAPDFLFLLKVDDRKILLEIKGEHLMGVDSKASIKTRAAEAWCLAMNDLGEGPWEHWFVLGSDAKHAQGITDLEAYANEWKEIHVSA